MKYKIDWDKYLSKERYRQSKFNKQVTKEVQEVSTEHRTPFESDFGRVAFSSALRRMHDKTQVIPLTSGDSVHTRLTHSIEVMSIAYSLGIDLCRDQDFIDLYKEKAKDYERDIPMILKTAAFVHDIGNPPFGHFGEDIIQNFFKKFFRDKYDKADFYKNEVIREKEKLDFINFDGNAQGFRILTRLQYLGELAGLNLTYATLAAYSKYPNDADICKHYIGTKKHGVFTSESDVLDKMVDACGMKREDGTIKRHPLSFLVEAADSISYYVMDIEDGLSMGWYTYQDIVNTIEDYMKKKNGEENYNLYAALNLKKDDNGKDEKMLMCNLRIALIRYLVNLTINKFKEHCEEIDKGIYTKELLEDGDNLAFALKDFAVKNIFSQRQIEQVELTGYSVLNGLLEFMTDCVFNTDNKLRSHLKSVFSRTFLKIAKHEDLYHSDVDFDPTLYKYIANKEISDLDLKNLRDYTKLRLIVDLISGMTDKFAVDVYRKLSGQRL